MDWLSSFAGSNGIPIILFAVLVVIVGSILVKKGILSFTGKGLRLGVRDDKLLSAELDLGRAFVDILPVDDKDYEMLFCREEVYNMVQEWIIFNNMSTDPFYIYTKSLKLKSVPNAVRLIDDIDAFTDELIRNLVKLKENWRVQ